MQRIEKYELRLCRIASDDSRPLLLDILIL